MKRYRQVQISKAGDTRRMWRVEDGYGKKTQLIEPIARFALPSRELQVTPAYLMKLKRAFFALLPVSTNFLNKTSDCCLKCI